jgi:predicted O-methyltransferase YrrM
MSIRNRAYEEVVKRLPGPVAGSIDLVRPSLRASWGGPLNGQAERRAIVRELARAVPVDLVAETGTFRGTSTEFFSAVFGVPIHTVEANPRFLAYSRRRLAFDPQITVVRGDSRPFLRDLTEQQAGKSAFIYLDAHWEEDLPLSEELAIVRDGALQSAVVMIDDFAVPDDAGYAYDDYGPGRSLVEDYLPPLPGWRLYYPAARSEQETGAKRGSAVLTTPSLGELAVKSLRFSRVL